MAFNTNYVVVYTTPSDVAGADKTEPVVLVNVAKNYRDEPYNRLLRTDDGTVEAIKARLAAAPNAKFTIRQLAAKEYTVAVNLGVATNEEAKALFGEDPNNKSEPVEEFWNKAGLFDVGVAERVPYMLHVMQNSRMFEMVGVKRFTIGYDSGESDYAAKWSYKYIIDSPIIAAHPESLKEEWEKKKAEPVTVSDSDDDKEEAGEGGAGAKHGRDEGAEVDGEPVVAKAARTDIGEAADTEGTEGNE